MAESFSPSSHTPFHSERIPADEAHFLGHLAQQMPHRSVEKLSRELEVVAPLEPAFEHDMAAFDEAPRQGR